jgi:hypothetical protein
VRSSEAVLLLRFIADISLITILVYCRFMYGIDFWSIDYRSVVVVYITYHI